MITLNADPARLLFDAVALPMWVYDEVTLRILEVNDAAIAAYGFDRGEFMAMTIADLRPMDDVPRLMLVLGDLTRDAVRHHQWRHRRKDGRIFEVDITSAPVCLRGHTARMVIARDLSAREAAERERAAHDLVYRQLLESAPDAILVGDARGHLLEANSRAVALTGYTADELRALPRGTLWLGENPAVDARWVSRMHPGDHVRLQRTLVRKDGSACEVEIAFTRAGDDRTQAIIRDVGASRAVAKRAEHAQRLEAVGMLTSGMAHDMNNMLTVIAGSADIIGEALPAEGNEREALTDLLDAVQGGAQLLRKLLSFARQARVETAPLFMDELVRHLATSLRRLLPESITLVVECDEALPQVLGDAGSLEQVLLNLALNARDAMPRGGTLTLRVRREPPADRVTDATRDFALVVVDVVDTGAGMSDEVVRRCFEPFYSTKPDGVGTGLGLAMVRNIVDKHGGMVTVASTLGAGTTFTVRLPAAPTDTAEATAIEPAAAPVGGTETILLVEDAVVVRRIAEVSLARRGYRVLTASDGEEAARIVEEAGDVIDLVVTDRVMPKMSGDELCRRVRARGAKARFLLASGYGPSDVSDADEALPVLSKPYTVDELLRRVRGVLDADPEDVDLHAVDLHAVDLHAVDLHAVDLHAVAAPCDVEALVA